jgi:parvulin-like peptidyl-prolyl isomerase
MTPRLALPLFLAAAACATAPKGNPSYLAKVNDEVITGEDLRQEFSRHHASLDKILGDRPEVEKYVGRLIDRRLFIQEGHAMDIENMPDVKADLVRFEDGEISRAFLKDEVDAKVTVSDEELKGAFALLSERIDVRQIVMPTREEAEQVKYLLWWGFDFEVLAREMSVGSSASRGGMFIVRWGADEEREKAVAPLKEGETTGIYQSLEGWEIDRLERRAPYQMMGMDKAQGFIRSTITRRKKTAAEEALRASLRAKYDVKFPECAPTLVALKGAAVKDDPTPCATWKGGQLTATELAKAVHIDQLEKVPADYARNRSSVVDELTDRELVKLEARAAGYAARPEIAAKVRRHQDDLVEAKLFADWVVKGVEVSDAEVKGYYEAHRDTFKLETSYDLAQIVVETPEAAAEVEAKLKAGQPFEELAATYSTDKANADKGGYVGALTRAQLEKEFPSIGPLAEGQVTAPLKSVRGFHVVKVLAVRPERQLTFDEAKDAAKERALGERREAAQERWVKKLRENATIEVSEAGIVAYQAEQLRRYKENEARVVAAKAAAEEAAAKAAAAKEAAAGPKDGAAPATPAPAKPAQP